MSQQHEDQIHPYYQVQQILDKRVKNSEIEYLIKWKGWTIKNSTWQPVQHLTEIPEMIAQYELQQGKRKEKVKLKQKQAIKNKRISKEIQKNNKIDNRFWKGAQRVVNYDESYREHDDSEQPRVKYTEIYEKNIQMVEEKVQILQIDFRGSWMLKIRLNNKQIQWVPRDFFRLVNPKLLLQFYQQQYKMKKIAE